MGGCLTALLLAAIGDLGLGAPAVGEPGEVAELDGPGDGVGGNEELVVELSGDIHGFSLPQGLKPLGLLSVLMYGLKPVPFKIAGLKASAVRALHAAYAR